MAKAKSKTRRYTPAELEAFILFNLSHDEHAKIHSTMNDLHKMAYEAEWGNFSAFSDGETPRLVPTRKRINETRQELKRRGLIKSDGFLTKKGKAEARKGGA
jgi:hypothetical protein